MAFKESPLYLYSKPDVTLVVGEEEIPVHESVIAVFSEFFKAALNCGLKESHERRIEINEIEPEILTTVLNWLYRVPLTPLFNTDPQAPETMRILLFKETVQKLNSILRAFDFLQIKSGGTVYFRFLEDTVRNMGVSRPYFEPQSTRNLVILLNEAYRYGFCLTQQSFKSFLNEVYRLTYFPTENYMWSLGEGIKTLQDPDVKFLQDISVSLTNFLLEQKKTRR
ncbi:hypothetical protein TWF506_011310 [Arthrobotrys conoides]|uniref:BTB domain-containing protein n=1 Tax=Arthrobotrys conoides TaxID=74498 RepID=A0AAN8NAD2_9PEZI